MELTATEKIVIELIARGVPMEMIQEGIRRAAKQVAADIVAGKGGFAPDEDEK